MQNISLCLLLLSLLLQLFLAEEEDAPMRACSTQEVQWCACGVSMKNLAADLVTNQVRNRNAHKHATRRPLLRTPSITRTGPTTR